MRVVREFTKDGLRLSIFQWNNKYLVKYEFGPMEQTFKLPETDVLDEADLDAFFEGEFFDRVKERFKEMGDNLQKQLENF